MKRFLSAKFLLSPLNILFVSFLVLVLVFSANALVYRTRGENYLSRLFVAINERSSQVTLNFDLNENEKVGFINLAKRLGSNWSGEEITLTVNQTLFDYLKGLDQYQLNIKASGSQLRFKGEEAVHIAYPTEGGGSWEFVNFLPEKSWGYYQGGSLLGLLPEELRKTVNSGFGALGLFNREGELNLVWVFKINDLNQLEDSLAELIREENKEATLSAQASEDVKVTEGVVETIRTFTFNYSKAPLTGGVIDNHLVITTGEEAFGEIARVKSRQGQDLGSTSEFVQNTASLSDGAINFYFAPRFQDQVTSYQNLEGLIDFNPSSLQEWKETGLKIRSLGVVVDQNLMLTGVLNLN